jgi:hypothetical protein
LEGTQSVFNVKDIFKAQLANIFLWPFLEFCVLPGHWAFEPRWKSIRDGRGDGWHGFWVAARWYEAWEPGEIYRNFAIVSYSYVTPLRDVDLKIPRSRVIEAFNFDSVMVPYCMLFLVHTSTRTHIMYVKMIPRGSYNFLVDIALISADKKKTLGAMGIKWLRLT